MIREKQVCVRCILDTGDDPELTFDEQGVCMLCNAYYDTYVKTPLTDADKNRILTEKILQIKQSRKGKYDSILGVSGGVDSTYAAYICKTHGLNPLLVHFDNGWNSETAVGNIENLTKNTGFDLYTYVVNWPEFRDLQLSFIKASVLDWELPTDHGFYAMLFALANKFKIRYILTGHNHQTEAILPKTMRHSKMDLANIIDIHNQFGKLKLKTFPVLGFWKYSYYLQIKKIERFNILEYLDEYRKDKVKEFISTNLGWRDYGGKHYESIFTRFYQGYVLYNKFGFDKRKAHLSNLICSGQMSREQALVEIMEPAYSEAQLTLDKAFVLKKLGLSEEEFESIMSEKPRNHLEFKSYLTGIYPRHEKFMRFMKPFTKVVRRILGK